MSYAKSLVRKHSGTQGKSRSPRLLFVAMGDSIHTARWISLIKDQGWNLGLFSPYECLPHSGFENITLYGFSRFRPKELSDTVRLRGIWPFAKGSSRITRMGSTRLPILFDRARWLARVVRWFQPDIIHSLEFQHAGYLTLAAKGFTKGTFPPWIATNWGSDIYLFGRLSEHVEKIRAVLASCDYYSCECERDVQLARDFGFRGQELPVVPNAGGLDLDAIAHLREAGVPSRRRIIVLKGYQGEIGRALVGLSALERCCDVLRDHQLAIYSATPEVKLAAESFANKAGIRVDIIPQSSHHDMLRLFGHARLYIGLSISDAISTSMLDAIAMGAFPIQSDTACADEWLVDGETGCLVPPEDPEQIADRIRRALTDDALVDHAAEVNALVTRDRLDNRMIRGKVVALYGKLVRKSREKS